MAEIKEGHELNLGKEGGIAEQMTPKGKTDGNGSESDHEICMIDSAEKS
jgi:hypothetical protein